ncbi:MAG TPA: hypothetical protein VFZ93_12830 [Albitalea sp.]
MALLRKCLIEVRTRDLPEGAFAFVTAAGPDTVFPPLDECRPAPGPEPLGAERLVRVAPLPPRRAGLND